MGRSARIQTTTKAVITNPVPTTLTTVYTNNTGVGAKLSSVNINGIGDPSVLTTSSGSDAWTFFGSGINPCVTISAATGTGFGVPYPVQLSDNRILIFFLPHFQHRGGTFDYMGGNTIHTQILEYQTNKYVAGPITTHTLPTAAYNAITYSLWSQPSGMAGSYGPSNWRAVALSSTKVVAAYRLGTAFRLMRFTITGNACDIAIDSVDLTSATYFNNTTAGVFDLAKVPGNPDKCIVGGYATTNWSLQAINVPDSGALTNASSLFSTTIAVSTYQFSLSRMVNTATANVTPYIIAAATSITAASAVIVNFNDNTNAFALSGSVVALAAASTARSGLQCACLSTDTTVNAVIATVSTGAGTNFVTYRQTSGAGASNTASTLSLQHSTAKSITEVYQWGDERVTFIGDNGLMVVYDSAGTATNLYPATETTNTTRWQAQWYPFNSRPLYNIYDPGTIIPERNIQYMSRTGMGVSATSVGVATYTGNYLPFGHDYGDRDIWSEPAGCWIVPQNGRIYALDTSGVVQGEVPLYSLSTTLDVNFRASKVQVTPSGRILFSADYGSCIHPSYNPWTTWNSLVNTLYCCVIEPVLSAAGLSRAKLQATPVNVSGFLSCNMVAFVEEIGTSTPTVRTERAYLLFHSVIATTQTRIAQFNGTTWADLTSTAIGSTTTGAWNIGFRSCFALLQDTPCSTAFTAGLWRVVGAQGTNSAANFARTGISAPFVQASFGSINTATIAIDSVSSTVGYGLSASHYATGSRSGTSVAAIYDETLATIRVFSSTNGRLGPVRGYYLTTGTSNNYRYASVATTKFAFAVTYQNTSGSAQTNTSYVFNNLNPEAPADTQTSTSGNGWTITDPLDRSRLKLYGTGVDVIYTIGGIPDDLKFYLAIFDGGSNTYYINNGQDISVITAETGLYRSTDVYTIPAGYSLKIRSNTANSLASLLSIEEQA